jgi:L-aminopeptidase/D-esterase-like protein
VEKALEEKGIGLDFVSIVLPIVVQAIIFDLEIGTSHVRPDFDMGYRACQNALKREKHPDGNVGAGIGATCGKMLGPGRAMKAGLGTYCLKKGDLFVGAVMTVNACGDVFDPETNEILAGALDEKGTGFVDAEKFIVKNFTTNEFHMGNTTIGCVITNAALNKEQAHKIAAWSHDGLARTIRPIHTMADGDTMFCMTSGEVEASMNLVGTMSVIAVENAIANAVRHADTLGGFRSVKEIQSSRR